MEFNLEFVRHILNLVVSACGLFALDKIGELVLFKNAYILN